MLTEDQIKTTFADVAGCDEAKEEVAELVFHQLGDFLFRFVTPGNVGESGFNLVFRQHAGFTPASRSWAVRFRKAC
jgi:hypothetical protein